MNRNPLTYASMIAACAVACAAFTAVAQRGTTMISLEAMTIGMPPGGFEFARTGKATWDNGNVVADFAANGGRAIEQSSTDRTDYRFPLAIYSVFRPRTSKLLSVSTQSPEPSIAPAASPCALSTRTTTTSCAPTRLRTMSACIALSTVVASR